MNEAAKNGLRPHRATTKDSEIHLLPSLVGQLCKIK